MNDVPWVFGSPRISDEDCRLPEFLDGSSVYARDSAIRWALWSKMMQRPEIDGVLELAFYVLLCLRKDASSMISLRVSSRRRTACLLHNYRF